MIQYSSSYIQNYLIQIIRYSKSLSLNWHTRDESERAAIEHRSEESQLAPRATDSSVRVDFSTAARVHSVARAPQRTSQTARSHTPASAVVAVAVDVVVAVVVVAAAAAYCRPVGS